MKVTFISDTHKNERKVSLPGGDILIFAGDCMGSGYNYWELEDFIDWFAKQPYKHKVFISGNHDRWAEKTHDLDEYVGNHKDDNVIYLCNDMVEIEGLKIYGTPYQPYFCGWAFNVPNPEKLYNIYKQIPENIDILVTHCPPYDILDKSHLPRIAWDRTGEEPLGSKELSKALDELKDKVPRYHVFGHIHGDGGKIFESGKTTYINASICDEAYDPINPPITLEIEPKGDE